MKTQDKADDIVYNHPITSIIDELNNLHPAKKIAAVFERLEQKAETSLKKKSIFIDNVTFANDHRFVLAIKFWGITNKLKVHTIVEEYEFRPFIQQSIKANKLIDKYRYYFKCLYLECELLDMKHKYNQLMKKFNQLTGQQEGV